MHALNIWVYYYLFINFTLFMFVGLLLSEWLIYQAVAIRREGLNAMLQCHGNLEENNAQLVLLL
jgi:hypothetical protein